MRRNGRVDNNQKEIVDALKAVFASVQHLHNVGEGCPDLLVGFQNKNFLLEVKQDNNASKLRQNQVLWHQGWSGQVAVVRNPEEAIHVITCGKYQMKDEQLALGGMEEDEEMAKFETYLSATTKPKQEESKKSNRWSQRKYYRKGKQL